MLPSTLSIPALLLLPFIFILSVALLHRNQHKNAQKQPPGPPPLPIIGNLHLLGSLPHRTLESLAKKYGPIMSLMLGQVPTIVVSSPEAAELFLKTYDTNFASRPKIQASEFLSYGSKGMAFAEYGPYWRSVKKLCTSQLLSGSKVEFFGSLRRKEVGLLVTSLRKAAAAREFVVLTEKVRKLVENIMYQMILGREKNDTFDVLGLVQEALTLAGAFNAADYVPWLAVFDLQGLTRRLKKTSMALDEVLENIIREHEQNSDEQKRCQKDFVDILLSLMNKPLDSHDDQNHVIDRTNVKAIVLDMIVGAFETSATVVDWALTELMRHPRVMKNLQDEFENVVGMTKIVEEIDLPNLSYLDMVVKEALRLYPVAPLLVPRKCREDVVIDGYYIKKNSRIIVNSWAIGRDTKIGSENAEVFYPERFMNSNIDFRGNDFRFLPFGSGRRGCPGMQLGLITVKLILAYLVHCFSWELPSGMTANDLDMVEKFGLAMPRARNLLAVPTCRLHGDVYDQFG